MKEIWRRISGEPAIVTGAITAIINVVVTFGLWSPTPGQIGSINTLLAATFALVVRATVQPMYGTPLQVCRTRPRRPGSPQSGNSATAET